MFDEHGNIRRFALFHYTFHPFKITRSAFRAGFTTDYFDLPLEAEAAGALKKGENVLAIHCTQKQGGQYIDAGLADEVRVEQK